MAKELLFKLSGSVHSAAPVKLERKKLYGWTDTVATDKDGEVCVSAYLSPEDSLIIPSGGLKQAAVDADGRWVDKSEMIAYGEDEQTELPAGVLRSSTSLVRRPTKITRLITMFLPIFPQD